MSDTPLKDNEFKCAACGGVFEKGWTEEEARAEEARVMGGNDPHAAVVCDDCYVQMMHTN